MISFCLFNLHLIQHQYNSTIFQWPTAFIQQIFTPSLQLPKNHLQFFSLPFPNLKFSVLIHDKTLFSSNFLLKASDVQHGYPNIQLMSEFFRFRKSYQWIWLLNRRLPYNLSNLTLARNVQMLSLRKSVIFAKNIQQFIVI